MDLNKLFFIFSKTTPIFLILHYSQPPSTRDNPMKFNMFSFHMTIQSGPRICHHFANITLKNNQTIFKNDQTSVDNGQTSDDQISVKNDQTSVNNDETNTSASIINDKTSVENNQNSIKNDQVRNDLHISAKYQTNFDELPFCDEQNISSVRVETGSLSQPDDYNYTMLLDQVKPNLDKANLDKSNNYDQNEEMENAIKKEIMIKSEVIDYEYPTNSHQLNVHDNQSSLYQTNGQIETLAKIDHDNYSMYEYPANFHQLNVHENQSNLYQTNGEIETLAKIDHDNYKMYVNHTEQSLYDGEIDHDNYKMYINQTEQTLYNGDIDHAEQRPYSDGDYNTNANNEYKSEHDNSEMLKDNVEPSIDDNTFENSFNSSFEDSFETLSETSMEIPQEGENKALKKICQVCSKEEINFTALKTHYIAAHFGGKLKSKFGDLVVEKTCVLCKKAFSSMANAFRHIGYAHNKLN